MLGGTSISSDDLYSPTVRNAIHTEIDKDLVKLPVHEIEKQLLPR